MNGHVWLTRRASSVTESNLNLVLADRYVRDIGKYTRLARRAVRIHVQNPVEVFRFRRLVLGYLRHEAGAWATPA